MNLRYKYPAIAIVGLLMAVTACTTKGKNGENAENKTDSTAADSVPTLCVPAATYSAAEETLLSDFRCVRSMDASEVKAVVIPRGMMDTVSEPQIKRIFRYYVDGGTLLFVNPLSRDWLYFWRKMERCRKDKSVKLSAKAATDLDNWAGELTEVASYSGRESMFDAPIAYVIGLRVGDYYSQSDSLDVPTMRRWLDGVPTATIVREQYERSQRK